MYHVEELPDASSALTPGWTYVPDTGFDPAQAAIAPSLGRKRGVRDPARGDLSSRQKNAIVRHLAELDRENHRDVAIPVKAREGRSRTTKSTQNVRRVLASQKTFRNFLDDEEAALALQPQPHQQSSRVNKSKSKSKTTSRKHEPPTATTKQPKDKDKETHPLLRSYTPAAPSDRTMQALLAEPPLPYNAARADPPSTGRSQRFFCGMCGHWGRIRCRSCHVRTCGLECFRLHEDSRCGAFF